MADRSRLFLPEKTSSFSSSFRPNPGQARALELLRCPQRHTLLVGGARSGKTFLLTKALITRAINAPGSRHVILRHRANAVWASIGLDTLPKVMSICFPGVPYKKGNPQSPYFVIEGSEIWLGGLDEQERVEKILGQEFCVDPNSLVLTADLKWVPAKDLQVGADLIGFPENLDGHLKLTPSTIERHETVIANKYRVITTRGETIVSENHQFVATFDDRRHRNFRSVSWRKTTELSVGDKIRFAVKPWKEGTSHEDGWFAGMLDGEGWISRPARQAGVAQCAGPLLDALRAWLQKNEISYREHVNGSKVGPKGPCYQLKACLWPAMRMLGISRPKRLDARAIWDGCRGFMARDHESQGHDAEILSIEPLGPGPVISMGTSTRTFIADGFLAHNCTIYLNECSEIRFSSVLVARTRLAQKIAVRESPDKFLTQRAYYDLNPAGSNHWTNREFGNGVDPVSGRPLANPDNFKRLFVNPEDNAANLTQDYLEELRNLPEKQRRRFYEGAYVSEIAGALWTYEELESWRVEESEVPTLTRIIVAVDPSGAAGKEDVRSDEIGIIVAGKGVDGRLYILADYSLRDGPDAWARAAIRAYHIYQADAIVGEVNFGKAMVEYTIRSIDPTVPIRQVTASRAKHVRAEPISNLYRQDKARHVGRFPNLEDQLVNFSVSGYIGEKSPDRADAMVWAATDLMLEAERPRLAFG